MQYWIIRTAQDSLAVTASEGVPIHRRVRGPFSSSEEAWLELQKLEQHNALAGLGIICAGVAALWLLGHVIGVLWL